jgi:hypothetical protein
MATYYCTENEIFLIMPCSNVECVYFKATLILKLINICDTEESSDHCRMEDFVQSFIHFSKQVNSLKDIDQCSFIHHT